VNLELVEKLKKKRKEIRNTLKTIFDPEIPTDIVSLGLIYGVDINPDGKAYILMTFTSPNCPAIQSMPEEITQKVLKIKEVKSLEIEITWDPAWNENMMTEEAKLETGLM